MVGVRIHVSMFYLFKLVDLQSHDHHNNSGVCFDPFHHLFLYIPHLKCS